MFQIIDVSGSGQIEYTEFLLATIPEKVLLTNENMAVVFKVYDDDGSGVISKDEIKRLKEENEMLRRLVSSNNHN